MSWESFIKGVANDLMNEIVKAAPFQTGDLINSIHVESTDDKGFTISMAKHGLYVEFGTPPHIIKPQDKKALHFEVGGEDVFATVVKHPGTKPNPFIRRTIHQKMERILHDNMKLHLGGT